MVLDASVDYHEFRATTTFKSSVDTHFVTSGKSEQLHFMHTYFVYASTHRGFCLHFL